MIALFLFSLLIGRMGFWLNSLCFAAFLLVLWDPAVLYGISFQLSFMAVLFIGFVLEKNDDEEARSNKLFRHFKQSVMLTLAASLGTLVAFYFHYFSVISPAANLLASPLIGFVLVGLSVVSSFFSRYRPLPFCAVGVVDGRCFSRPRKAAVEGAHFRR